MVVHRLMRAVRLVGGIDAAWSGGRRGGARVLAESLVREAAGTPGGCGRDPRRPRPGPRHTRRGAGSRSRRRQSRRRADMGSGQRVEGAVAVDVVNVAAIERHEERPGRPASHSLLQQMKNLRILRYLRKPKKTVEESVRSEPWKRGGPRERAPRAPRRYRSACRRQCGPRP